MNQKSLIPNITEHIFFVITLIATTNWLKRPDWNFAFGLLSYYMMKSLVKITDSKEARDVIKMLIYLNIALIVFDLVWIFTMGGVWHGKPTHDKMIWEGFSSLHSYIITMSVIIVILRIVAIVMLFFQMSSAGDSDNPKRGSR